VYEVSCPSCQAVTPSPFIRVGAAVTCAACKHRYLIDQGHIKRVPSSKPGRETLSDPLADPTQVPPVGDNEPGLSDLSEVMRREAERERSSKYDDYDTIKPSADPLAKPLHVVDPLKISDPAATPRQRIARNGYLLAAILAVVLAVLGSGITYVTRNANYSQPVEPVPKPVYQGPMFNGLPLAVSLVLGHHPWTQPNSPYLSQPQQDPEVYLQDDQLAPSDSGGIDYIGHVATEHTGVIVDAELTISLVNRQGIERARTTLPIAMVSPDQPMRVHLPIPANLDPTALTPAWSIEIVERLDPAIVIQGVSITPESKGADTMARLRIDNNTPAAINRSILVITAWDAQTEPLRRWKIQWDTPIESGERVEFYARTALAPSWRVERWSVDFAGE